MIELKLSIPDVNAILASLGRQPYAEVNDLIGRIVSQAMPQTKPQEPETQPA
jgi:hypothetical protein